MAEPSGEFAGLLRELRIAAGLTQQGLANATGLSLPRVNGLERVLARLDYAAATGQPERVLALTAGLAGLLQYDGPWADAITRHSAAVRTAGRLGDRLSQANALMNLAYVRRLTSDFRIGRSPLTSRC